MGTKVTLSKWAFALFTVVSLILSGEAVAQSHYAYVPNASDGTVSAIDLRSDRVEWTMKVGQRAAHGIAASPDGRRVYAGDSTTQEVIIIDAVRQSIIKRIPVGFPVHGIDISPDGTTVWAGGQAGNDPVKGTLVVINAAALTIEDMISPTLGAASHFAFAPDGGEVWIASTSTNLVWIVDASARRVAAAIPLSLPEARQRPTPKDDWEAYLAERKLIGLNEIALSPDGKKAYAVGPAASELFLIDVKTRQVQRSVHAGERAHGVTVSPNGREVWIADWAGMVRVFDSETLATLFEIALAQAAAVKGPAANHVAFAPEGGRVYVTSGNEVVVIDTVTRQIAARIPVGKEPHEISLEDWVLPRLRDQPSAPVPGRRSGLATLLTATAVSTDGLTRKSNERSVTVEVTPLNLSAGPGTLDFRIVLETHSIELDYDLVRIATLLDDRGNEYRPASWDGSTGGHHVEGLLKFAGRDRILSSGANSLEMRIVGVAGVPSRTFRWNLQP